MARRVMSGVVQESDCDVLGHMNVSRYIAACSDGVFALQREIGLDEQDMQSGRRVSFAVVHMESDFRAELHAGDGFYLTTEVARIGGKSLTFHHRLYRERDEALAFDARFTTVLLSLETRRAVTIGADLRADLGPWLAEAVAPEVAG